MNIGARTGCWAKSGGWVNPYQTADNALVAMWDGEWNAGGGVHDSTLTKWTNLIDPTYNMIQYGTPFADKYYWGDKYLHTESCANFDHLFCPTIIPCVTIEFVVKITRAGYPFFILSAANKHYYNRDIYASGKFYSQNCLECAAVSVNTIQQFAYVYQSNALTALLEKSYVSGIRHDDGAYSDYWNITGSQVGMNLGGGSTSNRPIAFDAYGVRMYSRELTATEIAARYAIDKERFNLPG